MIKKITAYLFIFFFCLSPFSFSQAFDWEWLNTKPTGNSLNDVIILPNGNFLGFGEKGTIIKSTDSGVNWDSYMVDSAGGYRSIYEADFVDNNIGFASGLDGLILKTTDGGDSWEVLTSGTTNDLWYIDFIDADTGYACGSSSTLLKTTDGGVTWNSITVSGTSTTLYKIQFINPSTGYIGTSSSTVGRLLRTTDYGASWNSIGTYPGTGTTRGIYFFDADTGYVTNSLYQVYKTTDAGASWAELADFGTGTLYEIKFLDAASGVAAGANGEVWVTTNGGTSWDSTNTSYTSSNVYGIATNANLGEKGLNSLLAGGYGGSIAYSNNLGTTWTPLATSVSMDELREIQFVNSNVGYAVGGSTSYGQALKTTDGGNNWELLSFDPGYRLYSLNFVNENVGYVGRRGPDGIFKTTDGGTTWSPLLPNVGTSSSIWYEMAFADEMNGYASGSSNSLVKTTDGGTTWTPLTSGFSASTIIYGLHMFDASTFVIAGSSSNIAITTDGGSTFTPLTSPSPTTTLYNIYFYDSNIGYASGVSGRVFKTTDGGSSWVQQTTPITTSITDVKFISPSTGWMAAWSGNLMYTTNGGSTWTLADKFPSFGDVQKLAMTNGYLYTCGEAGHIIRGFTDPTVPVELSSFSANIDGNAVNLKWQTATEINNMGFDVERKASNSSWEKIAFITGYGTTTDSKSYTYSDKNPARGINYYRLKQTDFDGSYEYSKIVEVEFNSLLTFNLEQNYPNPFNPVTKIKYSIPSSGLVTLKVYNIIGEEVASLVNEIKDAGSYNISFDASKFASGVYYYKLQSGDFSNVKKMIILK